MKIYNIFLADDDEDDRYAFTLAMNELNESVSLVHAEDGEKLLSLLDASKTEPHLIVLDINMPKKSGLDCLDGIRAAGRFKATPIVIFSTSIDKKAIEHAKKHGADFYIQKPDNFVQLKKITKFCIDVIANKAAGIPSAYPFFISQR
jgi:CheY-like chemotaxis protein